jgi:hypothetical protein
MWHGVGKSGENKKTKKTNLRIALVKVIGSLNMSIRAPFEEPELVEG